jgi:hypothetical protein
VTDPEIADDVEDSEYRARHARRRRIIAAGLLLFFIGVPGIVVLLLEYVF